MKRNWRASWWKRRVKSWLKTQHSKTEDHGVYSYHFTQIDRKKVETVSDFIFLGSKITADRDCSHEIKRRLLLRRQAMTNRDSVLKSRDITLPTKGPYSQSYGFSSSHLWMWELDHKEGWVPENGNFPTVVLEKIESPLDSKEIKDWESLGQQDQTSQS